MFSRGTCHERQTSKGVLEGSGLDGAAADYWIRIFTPDSELPFSGHVTL